jgi:phenylacetate-CoA ligase
MRHLAARIETPHRHRDERAPESHRRVHETPLEAIYRRLPIPLQQVACSLQGFGKARIRLGSAFARRLEELSVSEWWSKSEIAAYQDERLRGLVRHAYANVPFYRERLQELGLTPRDIRGCADLPKLPILTKEDVRQHRERMVADGVSRRRLLTAYTGGTTGTALQFYSSPEAVAFQWAVWWRHRQRFGLTPEDWHVNFTGKLVVPPEQRQPPYWRWNLPMRQVLFGMQHLTAENAPAFLDCLAHHAFSFWSGYPSMIHAFVQAVADAGEKVPSPPRVVVTGAETLRAHQRRDLEQATGATITDQYGLAEACGNASQCPEGRYHEDFEFGILECLPQEGGKQGRVVCTGLADLDFPFLRYDSGDLALSSTTDETCPCGRQSAILRAIEGRVDDVVLTPEGLRISSFDYVFDDTPQVRECQILQERPGAITVRVVRRPAYRQSDEDFIRAEIARWISPLLETRFEYPTHIEREANGKFRAVKSMLT